MKKGKVIVFGLDGATWNILRPMMDAGLLPNFSRVAKEGVWGTMKSTIPPVTPPAWATFVTGKNPGKHGLFGFIENRNRESKDICWANEQSIKTNKIWDLLDYLGRTSSLINIPISYPPRNINGWLLTGYLTPENAENVSYPPELKAEIDNVVGNYIVNTSYKGEASLLNTQIFTDWNLECIEKRKLALFHIWDKYNPDLQFIVFDSPDRLQHKLYCYLDPDEKEYSFSEAKAMREKATENYRAIDGVLGDIMNKMDDDTTLIIASDHGFGKLHSYVSLNLWLAKKGYLKFKKIGAWLREINKRFSLINTNRILPTLLGNVRNDDSIENLINWGKTKVYAGDIFEEGIYLNVEGREKHGVVKQGTEYNELRDKVIEELKELKYPGTEEKMFSKLIKREDIYNGDFVNDAPDILVELEGHDSLITNNLPAISKHFVKKPRNPAEGSHRPDGIFMASGSTINDGLKDASFKIEDMTPTILHAMGEPTFSDLDGSAILSIFKEKIDQKVVDPLDYNVQSDDSGYTDEETREIEDRLRQLGYIE